MDKFLSLAHHYFDITRWDIGQYCTLIDGLARQAR